MTATGTEIVPDHKFIQYETLTVYFKVPDTQEWAEYM